MSGKWASGSCKLWVCSSTGGASAGAATCIAIACRELFRLIVLFIDIIK